MYEAEHFSRAARVPALGTESGGGGSCSCSFMWASWQRALQGGWRSARCHRGVRATTTLCYGLPLLRGCQRLQVFPLAQGTCLTCATLAASHASRPSLAPRWCRWGTSRKCCYPSPLWGHWASCPSVVFQDYVCAGVGWGSREGRERLLYFHRLF